MKKLLALVRYWIELIHTSPNNQYWHDNKPVLKIPLVLTLRGLGCLSNNLGLTDDPPKWFIYISKTENKKAEILNIRGCTAIGFHESLI